MNLVIVESPTKAKTIGKFLGKEYEIKASMGHLMDLPKSKMGIDIEHDFLPAYELIVDKQRIISDLRAAAKIATSIILATDPDREGEAIASHVKDMLIAGIKGKGLNEKFKRVVFHEITEEAIKEAFNNARDIDAHLVDAQTARRVLDRLVGYKLSPMLWRKVRRGLSAGRVQSIALRLIVEREREIEKFKKEPYYTITAIIKREKGKDHIEVTFELVEINNEKIELQSSFHLYDGEYNITKTILSTEEKAKKIVADLQTKKFTISDVVQKEAKRSPMPPYTTSTLQQDASRRLGFSGKRTMSLAQKLYEEGFITYHRTDSVVLAASAVNTIRGFIQKEYGEKYLPESPRFYTGKQKLAQEAHEAIRPTAVGQISNIKFQISNLGNDYWKLYDMIWKRTVASQMSDARIESTVVLADTKGSKDTYRFKANGSVLVFDGFLRVNPQALSDNRLPEFVVGESVEPKEILATPHETTSPPRYNDASIIKTLEEKGIGRPSTYATIIGTIQDRQYVERDPSTGGGRFKPTAIGVAVNDFLVKNFSEIDDIPFTADMEDDLDRIANGEKAWVPIMKQFYTPFEKKLKEVEGADRVKIEVEKTDEMCPECGEPIVIRMGRFGKFFSCSKFPECKYTKQFAEETGLTCPKCGGTPRVGEPSESRQGKVIVKKTRKGRKFFGCSNYPNCDFAAWKLEDIDKSAKPTAITKKMLGVKKIIRRRKK